MSKWKLCKLEEVCDFQNGFAFKSTSFTKEGEPIIRISDIQNGEIDDSNVVYFNPASYKEDLSRFLVFPNDILIAMSGGTTGKIGVNTTNKTFYLNQRVGVFREKAELNHNYLYYYLITKSEESLRIAAGAAQPNLSTAQIKSFIIPVPPLSEQQRIVDILDAEFAKIDALKENTEKNLQNTKQLIKACLKETFTVRDRWSAMTIGDVCEFQNGFAFKSNLFTSEGEPIIRISDIQNDEVIDSNVVYFNPSSYSENLSRFKVYPNDILIAMSGGTTGKVGINRTGKTFYLNQRVGVLREKQELLDHMFLYYYLHTKSEESLKISAGAAQPNLSTGQIKSFIIPIPKLSEQKTAVARLNFLNDKCKMLEIKYVQTIALCDNLKQALLRKAFNGEL